MKKQKSSLKSGFFNPRALAGIVLCLLGAAMAVLGFRAVVERQKPVVVAAAEENETEPTRERDMPTLGESTGDERRDLERAEQFWNDRLTYPTGKFDPAWVRAAAEQHKRMPAAVPAGSFEHLIHPKPITVAQVVPGKNKGEAASVKKTILQPRPLALSTSGMTSLGPPPCR